jgi:hypothetical protein
MHGTRSRRRLFAIAAVMVMVSLMAAGTAYAGTTWSSETPGEGSVLSAPLAYFSVDVACTEVMNAATRVVTVDSVARTSVLQNPWVYPVDGRPKLDKTRATIKWPGAPSESDGMHSVSVSVANAYGVRSAHTWDYEVRCPPTLGAPVPADGGLTTSVTPEIAIPAFDNSAVTSWTATVNGERTPAVLIAGILRVLPVEPLPNDMLSTVSVAVTDGLGLVTTKTWSFGVQIFPEMASDVDCESCHFMDEYNHTYHADDCAECHYTSPHPGTPTQTHGPADVSACRPCHVSSLTVEHARYGRACATCHDSTDANVIAAIAGGDSSCDTCHGWAGHEALHVIDPAPDYTCADAACHATMQPVEAHLDAVGPGGTYPQYETTCALCHENEDPDRIPESATADCASCHPERLEAHGYDPEDHTSQEACLGACHSAELVPAHNDQAACTNCHPVRVEAIEPWDKTCDPCHATAAPAEHPTPEGVHVGSDALVRDYTNNFAVRTSMSTRLYPFGCTPTAASGQTICHDVSDLAALHGEAPDKGCAICHRGGAASAGATECLTCHGTGWYSPSISKGTVARPGSDVSASGVLTAVGGSGVDNYSTLLTNDGAASYLRFATTNAQALFGKGTWWLNPNTTTITNVQVVFRAMKLTAGATASRMTAIMDVGGTTYVSAATATDPSTAAYTLYTHTFTTNPKTGAAWTFDDLNDPESVNGLRSFGLRQTLGDLANIGVTEVLLKVNTPDTAYTSDAVSGGTAHHYGDYLRSPETSTGEWSSAIYTQYCYDRCHVYPNTYAYYGQVLGNPTYNPFNAYAGDQMWSSLMGDPNGNSPLVRKLTLQAIELPEGSPRLDFKTNYVLGAGDSGRVEISTDDGSTWTGLGGVEDGTPVSDFTGVAGSWRAASFDLTAYAGQTVKLRFTYSQAPTSTTAGWCIDNVVVSEGGTVLFSDDAETLRPEWDSASHWRRIKYALRWLG